MRFDWTEYRLSNKWSWSYGRDTNNTYCEVELQMDSSGTPSFTGSISRYIYVKGSTLAEVDAKLDKIAERVAETPAATAAAVKGKS